MRALAKGLKEQDIPYRTDVSAKTLCTFRVGGTVKLVIEPRCEGELLSAVSLCRAHGVPYEILGNGSNVLFEDGDLSLAVIRTVALDAVRTLHDGVYAGCGVSLPQLCRLAALRGLGGLTFACGIPGTLGGALAMNAGAHGKSLSDVVKYVKILEFDTGDIKTDFNFKKNASYRNCGFNGKNVLFLGAELLLEADLSPESLLREMQRIKEARRSSQPLELPSAGCAFRRPRPDVPIGRLLDELGCKGMRVGGAEVSKKHAAFIVNRGGATAADTKKLMWEIQQKAEKERGMILESEIRIISG
jgi:UDP-N-acetylmuramate dehydrogenase